jgi:hypothetical protein
MINLNTAFAVLGAVLLAIGLGWALGPAWALVALGVIFLGLSTEVI